MDLLRRKTPFVIILFFHAGFKPKQIIEMGYPESTVYKYSARYKEALKEFQERIGEKRS